MSEVYTLDTAIKAWIDDFARNMNVCLPARVISFDATKQQASVQPDIKAVVQNDDSNEYIINRLGDKVSIDNVDMPVIEGVPVQYPRAGAFMVTMPITAGDTGLIVFSQRDISRWITEGSGSPQADLSLFDYSNAIYIPGIANEKNAISDYNPSALEVRASGDKITLDGDKIVIKPSSGNTEINDATDYAVLFNELKILYDKLVSDLNIELGKKVQVPATTPITLVSDLTPAKATRLKI